MAAVETFTAHLFGHARPINCHSSLGLRGGGCPGAIWHLSDQYNPLLDLDTMICWDLEQTLYKASVSKRHCQDVICSAHLMFLNISLKRHSPKQHGIPLLHLQDSTLLQLNYDVRQENPTRQLWLAPTSCTRLQEHQVIVIPFAFTQLGQLMHSWLPQTGVPS